MKIVEQNAFLNGLGSDSTMLHSYHTGVDIAEKATNEKPLSAFDRLSHNSKHEVNVFYFYGIHFQF